jgi:hypothetical protein
LATTMRALILASAALALTACSDDGAGTPPAGGAGGAGAAGASNGGGSAGTSGSGGTLAGSGGGAEGGTSGSAGEAGAAGEAGFVEPTLLSQTGLYSEIASDTLAADVRPFQPRHQLWSDGAAKRRFVYLPPGSQIDTTDMDYWVYPVGTKVWKEFTRDGVRVETRLLQKVADDEWFMMAFRWNEQETEAEAVPNGEMNARGTTHDIPSQRDCGRCHDNMTDKLLGFSALQLSHDLEGLKLSDLIGESRLTAAPAGALAVPGNAVERAALGYLHANCGHCHNPESVISTVDMELWLTASALDGPVSETPSYLTTVGQDTTSSTSQPWSTRIVPGDVEASAIYQRMIFVPAAGSGQNLRMPPLASEIVDPDGSDAVRAWIEAL